MPAEARIFLQIAAPAVALTTRVDLGFTLYGKAVIGNLRLIAKSTQKNQGTKS